MLLFILCLTVDVLMVHRRRLVWLSTIGVIHMSVLHEVARSYLLRSEPGSVIDWADECLEPSPDSALAVSLAHMNYAMWCRRKGYSAMGIRIFSRDVSATGVRRSRDAYARHFVGLRIRAQPPDFL